MGSDPFFGMFTDGVLAVDKPAGPTSHDIVAVARRLVRPRKVGHTGTLDPLASGVLPLVLGKATRLAQFISGADKEYEADIDLGRSTTTFDRAGDAVPQPAARPVWDLTITSIDHALHHFRGSYLQQPPAFSAKKIDGDRAYDLARRNAPVALQPAPVTVHVLDIVEWQPPRLRLRVVCSAGFYVRTLAHEVGDRLGTGGHLAGLRRTRSGDFSLEDSVTMEDLDRRPSEAAARVVPLARLLPGFPAVTLTPQGAARAARGGAIGRAYVEGGARLPEGQRVRLLDPAGRLIAIAETRFRQGEAILHPGVVLE
jgi:tRNA pseudouridine55 synthase